jgi:YHS domain-containing protein
MMVDKATALAGERGGRAYYFCSESCKRTFESPEAELEAMKTRVTIALTGVLALAILRARAFILVLCVPSHGSDARYVLSVRRNTGHRAGGASVADLPVRRDLADFAARSAK